MNDVKTQTKHTNIADVVLGRIKKYHGKKKNISKEEKKNMKHILKMKKEFLLLKILHVM